MKIKELTYLISIILLAFSCQEKKEQDQFQRELQSIGLLRGDIALCGSDEARLGNVQFGLSCIEEVRENFNLATALLHSFEYAEAEKIFAKVIDEDPDCLMAYWGVAMSNFHPLWAPPTKEELEKGYGTIQLARTRESKSQRESDYLEAVAVMYDNWDELDHKTRILKFEKAAEEIFIKYPDDKEAAIFYALALRAAADPTDKSFVKQRKAGKILNSIFPGQPNHPGIAHYLIHTYDYPELAELALPAAKKYASIAATSAHALHMPSHIFVRLGLWDEAIESNMNSIAAAQCYAENTGMKGHWDEELHGIDYLVYSYLQQGNDEKVKEQLEYLQSMKVVFPFSNKNAYTFAAVPTRYALERKDWEEAEKLELIPTNFPWPNYPWERAIVSFGKALGAVHRHNTKAASIALSELKMSYAELMDKNKSYEANQVQIQIKAVEGWSKFSEGHKEEALRLMTEAATMEDATDKPPVTPGEVIPARELLGDMLLEMKEYAKALEAYEADIQRHPGRFNGLFGAGIAAQKVGDMKKAESFFRALIAIAKPSGIKRRELVSAELFLAKYN